MVLLIRGSQIFDGESLHVGDILIEGGEIIAIGANLSANGAQELDAEGCVVSPGFTDLHVHLREPGYEHKETIATGTAAAAAGGFTTVCAMPNLRPVPDSPETLEPQLDAILAHALVRVLPYGSVSFSQKGDVMVDIPGLAGLVCGFSDDGRGVQSRTMLRTALRETAQSGSFVAAHCEVESMIPREAVTLQENCDLARQHGYIGVSNWSEWAEVERDVRLVDQLKQEEQINSRLHICHASAAETFNLVRKAKQNGLAVTCEVTPHNLLLSCNDIEEDNGRFKMNPPLRTPADRDAALAALLDGTVDAIATDHAPHTPAEKMGNFADSLNGVVGLETAFAVLYTRLVDTGLVPIEQLLTAFTAGPRRVLGEDFNKLRPGHRADLVVLDLEAEGKVKPATFLSKGRATPFAGWTLKGWPILTLYDGKAVWQAGCQL